MAAFSFDLFQACGTFVMSCIVSLVMIGVSVFMMAYEVGDRSIWIGIMSTILGIWLPSPKIRPGNGSGSTPILSRAILLPNAGPLSQPQSPRSPAPSPSGAQ